VLTSFWMLLVYLQDRSIKFLFLAVLTGICGLLVKISGLIVGVPILYVIMSRRPGIRFMSNEFVRLSMASIFVLLPVIGYYVWAIHVSHTYPPFHRAASGNWVWDYSFGSWLKHYYFLPKLSREVHWLWGGPLLVSAFVGLIFPSGSMRWLFHYWLLAGIIFYVFGAQELVNNPWNFHILDPAIAGLAAQGLLVGGAALARVGVSKVGLAVAAFIVAMLQGVVLQNLRWVYAPYARETRELGLALARFSRPSDLVITVANDIGDPGAIYYSHRRGWVFPPAQPGVDWAADIVDDPVTLQLFEQLRSDGAQWFGIVGKQKQHLQKNSPKLLAHIEERTDLISETLDWTIYRIRGKPQMP